jgi:hypothetical protein
MIVDREVSLAIIRKEIAECDTESNGWTFSEIDEANQSFRVHMKAKDDQLYIIEIKFDDYKRIPRIREGFSISLELPFVIHATAKHTQVSLDFTLSGIYRDGKRTLAWDH